MPLRNLTSAFGGERGSGRPLPPTAPVANDPNCDIGRQLNRACLNSNLTTSSVLT